MVPGAGIEPARLAAGDFESPLRIRLGAACRHILGASKSVFQCFSSEGMRADAPTISAPRKGKFGASPRRA